MSTRFNGRLVDERLLVLEDREAFFVPLEGGSRDGASWNPTNGAARRARRRSISEDRSDRGCPPRGWASRRRRRR